jgi:two-component system NarL family sensor kinase
MFDDPPEGICLPRQVEIGLFRVAQEALANARKHAGSTPIWVSLEQHGATIRLEVRDHGKGFDADAPMRDCMAGERVGLVGMRERMALLGGVCVIASQPGEGTRIIAAVPVEQHAGDDA